MLKLLFRHGENTLGGSWKYPLKLRKHAGRRQRAGVRNLRPLVVNKRQPSDVSIFC